MKIVVRLFALAKQQFGAESLEIELPPGACLRDLKRALAEQHPPLAELLRHSRFSINTEFAADDDVLDADDEVACIPPVSGG